MLKFSIITVCYNAEKDIKMTIESVLHQSYSEIELLIIDGASTDGTRKILKEYSEDKRLFIFSQVDNGIYDAMNRGIKIATGDYVIFLNAGDVFYENDVLSKIYKHISNDKIDIIIGNYLEYRHEISKIVKMNFSLSWKEIVERGYGICHQAIIARIACLKGGFNRTYKIASDFEWFCRMINLEYKIKWVDVIISVYSIYGVSGLAKNWMKVKEECRQIVEINFPYMKERIQSEIDLQFKTVKNQRTLEYLSDFLALKQRNRSIIEFLKKNSIYQIAIYGFQYLGQRLLSELEKSEINVAYIIDRDHSFCNINTPLKYINDVLEPVDAIIVTPIFEFYDIKNLLEDRFEGKIISIEDIINSMYLF